MSARAATAEDAGELVRLRAVLLRTLARGAWDDDWRDSSRQVLVKNLDAPDASLAAFVVDRPDDSGLAACAVGTIEQRLGQSSSQSRRPFSTT